MCGLSLRFYGKPRADRFQSGSNRQACLARSRTNVRPLRDVRVVVRRRTL